MASLTHGPFLQGGRSDGAAVWFRLDGDGEVRVRVGDLSWSKSVDSSTNYCGAVSVSGLTPATEYQYTIEVDGVQAGDSYSFMTLPAEGAPATFDAYFLADHHFGFLTFDPQVEYVYRQANNMLRSGIPRVAVTLGDFELPADNANEATRISQYLTIRGRGAAERTAWEASTPNFAVWDDWDGGGNNVAGAGAANRAMLSRVWRNFWSGLPPGPPDAGDGIHFSFRVADCLFILTDGRTFNSPTAGTYPQDLDYDPETVVAWGDAQLEWIKATLLEHQECAFKVLVVSTTIMDNVNVPVLLGSGRDSIGIFYRAERNRLLSWLLEHPEAARGLVVVTGDDHCQTVYRAGKWRSASHHTNPLSAYELENGPQIIEWKPSPFYVSPGTGLHLPWEGSPDVYFNQAPPPRCLGRVRFETDREDPVAVFGFHRINPNTSPSPSTEGIALYEFALTRDGAFLPKLPQPTTYTERPDPPR